MRWKEKRKRGERQGGETRKSIKDFPDTADQYYPFVYKCAQEIASQNFSLKVDKCPNFESSN